LCLDCEFAREEAARAEYAQKVIEGAEWGVAHPHTLESPPSGYLVNLGFRRGLREARKRVRMYNRALKEFEMELGRRRAMLYCAHYLKHRKHLKGMPKLWDWNLLHEIQAFLYS